MARARCARFLAELFGVDDAGVFERLGDEALYREPSLAASVLSIDDIVLWGLQRGGVTKKRLAKALRSIYAAHNPLFETEEVESSPSNRDLSD